MRIVSIVGHKNSGKTTLAVALAREFARQKKRVGTIKHSSHPAAIDAKGTDSWRHYHEGLADGVMVVAPDMRVVIERRPDDTDPESLARRFFGDRDLVIVEGFKRAPIPKIEVFRKSVGPAPLATSGEYPGPWIAIVSDVTIEGAPCPVLRFTDTMWLQLLATMLWEQAKPVAP